MDVIQIQLLMIIHVLLMLIGGRVRQCAKVLHIQAPVLRQFAHENYKYKLKFQTFYDKLKIYVVGTYGFLNIIRIVASGPRCKSAPKFSLMYSFAEFTSSV